MTKVEYTLSGCANGHPVRIEGTGMVGRSNVRIRFRVKDPSLTFDAGLARLVATDALVAVARRLVVTADLPVVARSRADLLAEGGIEVGTILAVATIQRHRGRLLCRAQLTAADVAVEVGERVTALSERTITTIQVGSDTVLMSAFLVSTSRGRQWTALCSTVLLTTESAGSSITLPPLSVAGSGQ